MQIRFSSALQLAVGTLLSTCSLAAAQLALAIPEAHTAPAFHPGHVMVRTIEGADTGSLDAKAGVLRTLYASTLVPGLRCVEVADGSVAAAIATYQADASVLYANPDYYVYATAQTTPYGITNVNAAAVWPVTRGSGVIVADLDTGFDFGHPDLPVPIDTASFVTGETVQDGNSHGTHTAGTICAVDNTIGVVGVAPEISLIVGKVLGDGGSGLNSWVAAGIDWAASRHARVVNMSLGGYGFDQGMNDVCAAALAANTLIIAAVGNDNSADILYPSGYPSVLAVAAVDSANNRASFSNFGAHVSLSGPGVGVLSTVPAASVTWQSVSRSGLALAGSADGTVSGNAVFCGVGNAGDFPPEVNGQIAHIRRGSISFATKTNNAIAAGAIGVIISNNNGDLFSGTLQANFPIPVVGISQTDGDALQAVSGVAATLSTSGGHTYASYSGTSMATPHVSGVAALLAGFGGGVADAPHIRAAMEQTATDLGDSGRDIYFGFGGVNASAAMAAIQTACTPAPALTAQPSSTGSCPGSTATFTVRASGAGTFTYVWRKDGVAIDAGGNSSAATAVLTLSDVQGSDAGNYDCIVTNACRSLTTTAASLTVCVGDFNCDGGVDGSDLEAFFRIWESGQPAGDVNGDGGVDGGDIEYFILRWEAGC